MRVIAGGATARLISLPVSAISTALTAYLMIRYVGDEHYGFVSLVATLFLLMPFADFGLGVVVINAMARVRPGESPTSKELQTIWRVLIRLIALSALMIVLAFIVAAFGGWSRILNIPPQLAYADFATAVALSVYFAAIPLSVGQRVLVGMGRVKEMTLISLTAPVSTTGLIAALIATDTPPMFLGVAPAIGLLLNNLVMSVRSLHHLNVSVVDLRNACPDSPPERLGHSALSFFIFSLGLPIAMQSGRVILANFSTATELSAYSLVAQMYVPTLSVITVGALALWPAYKHRGDNARTLWLSSLKTLTIVGLLVGGMFVALAPLLAKLISRGEIKPSTELVLAFGVLILVTAMQQASGQLLTDQSGLRFQAYCVIALALISISLSVVFAQRLGAVGPALASVIAITFAQLIPGILWARRSLERR